MVYAGTSKEQSKTVSSGDALVSFQTVLATVNLKKCDADVGLQGGSASYASGSWYSFGTTDVNGVATKELFPGTYSFRMDFKGTSKTILADISSAVVFRPTKVTLNYSGSISYASGSWYSFQKPTMYLFPGTYTFRFDSQTFPLTIPESPCNFGGNVVIAKLNNNNVQLVPPTKYYLECSNGAGTIVNGLYLLTGTIRCRAHTNFSGEGGGDVMGPWFYWNTQNNFLNYEYATLTLNLYNGETVLNKPLHFLEIQYIGEKGTGDVFHVPHQATLRWRGHADYMASSANYADDVLGPWTYTTFNKGDQTWNVEFATLEVLVYNGGTVEAPDETLVEPLHFLEVQYVGEKGTGDVFHIPHHATLRWRGHADYMNTAGVYGDDVLGPWTYTTFNGGEQVWGVEFATLTLNLFNETTALTNTAKYYLEIQYVGNRGYAATIHIPHQATLRWRGHTTTAGGDITGPWRYTTFVAGVQTWNVEYATVTFKFVGLSGTCLKTEITSYGAVPNNTIDHFPHQATLRARANVCGTFSNWQYYTVTEGDGALIWGFGPGYTQP